MECCYWIYSNVERASKFVNREVFGVFGKREGWRAIEEGYWWLLVEKISGNSANEEIIKFSNNEWVAFFSVFSFEKCNQ